jgi:hypothetical protein
LQRKKLHRLAYERPMSGPRMVAGCGIEFSAQTVREEIAGDED